MKTQVHIKQDLYNILHDPNNGLRYLCVATNAKINKHSEKHEGTLRSTTINMVFHPITLDASCFM